MAAVSMIWTWSCHHRQQQRCLGEGRVELGCAACNVTSGLGERDNANSNRGACPILYLALILCCHMEQVGVHCLGCDCFMLVTVLSVHTEQDEAAIAQSAHIADDRPLLPSIRALASGRHALCCVPGHPAPGQMYVQAVLHGCCHGLHWVHQPAALPTPFAELLP
jgi:hypothetical protein